MKHILPWAKCLVDIINQLIHAWAIGKRPWADVALGLCLCDNINPLCSITWIYQLSYTHADATAYSFARFGQGSGPIYLDQVGCTGSEAMLGDCTSNPIGLHDCSHFEDAGVGCQGTFT